MTLNQEFKKNQTTRKGYVVVLASAAFAKYGGSPALGYNSTTREQWQIAYDIRRATLFFHKSEAEFVLHNIFNTSPEAYVATIQKVNGVYMLEKTVYVTTVKPIETIVEKVKEVVKEVPVEVTVEVPVETIVEKIKEVPTVSANPKAEIYVIQQDLDPDDDIEYELVSLLEIINKDSSPQYYLCASDKFIDKKGQRYDHWKDLKPYTMHEAFGVFRDYKEYFQKPVSA